MQRKDYAIIFVVVFSIYFVTSFDGCWFAVSEGRNPDWFVFGPDWIEHLHSNEENTIYYQIQAFSEGRAWLSRYTELEGAGDVYRVGDKYYAFAEPATALFLLPFYSLGNLLLGGGWLIRSVLIGMMFYTCLSVLLVRKITFQINPNDKIADLTAYLFAFATMAFSYSRLLYPQPIVCLLSLFTVFFLFRYKQNPNQKDLFIAALFYGLSIFSFNALVVTLPVFFYFFYKTGLPLDKKTLPVIIWGVLPSAIMFFAWNYITTGNPLMNIRQYIHPTITFHFFFQADQGIWFNLEGVFGQLFSPVGILFVSPILFTALFGFYYLKSKAKEETIFLFLLFVVLWLFTAFASHPGDVTQRDFWIGGWASIARYMYFPSAVLMIFVSGIFETIHKQRKVLAAWFVSFAIIISFLANLSLAIHRTLMKGDWEELGSGSLLVLPFPLTEGGAGELAANLFGIGLLLISLIYPVYLFTRDKDVRELIQQQFQKITHIVRKQ